SAIKSDDLSADTGAGEFLLDELAARRAEGPSERAIGGETINGLREGLDIIARYQQRVHVGPRDGTAAWHIRCNERAPAGGRLDKAQRQSLAMGRQNGNVRLAPERRDILDKPQIGEISLRFPALDLIHRDRS